MDLRSLRYYVAIVEEGSISAAALRCHVAQPSITLALAKLEDELDCRLLHRHTKGCEATADGQKMYLMAQDLLHHAKSIKHAFNRNGSRIKQRIAIDKTVRIGVLEELVSRAENAGLELELEIVSDPATADLRLTIESQLNASENFLPLVEEHYALLIPDNNVLAFQKSIQISDLNQQSLIKRIYCAGQQQFQQGCRHHGIQFSIVARVETEEWAHGLVASKLGMAFAPVPLNFSDPRFVCRNIKESLGLETPVRHVGIALKAKADPRLEALRHNL